MQTHVNDPKVESYLSEVDHITSSRSRMLPTKYK